MTILGKHSFSYRRASGVKPILSWTKGTRKTRQATITQPISTGHGSEIVVLARGMQLCLQTCKETLDFLREREVTWRIVETTDAVRI